MSPKINIDFGSRGHVQKARNHEHEGALCFFSNESYKLLVPNEAEQFYRAFGLIVLIMFYKSDPTIAIFFYFSNFSFDFRFHQLPTMYFRS